MHNFSKLMQDKRGPHSQYRSAAKYYTCLTTDWFPNLHIHANDSMALHNEHGTQAVINRKQQKAICSPTKDRAP